MRSYFDTNERASGNKFGIHIYIVASFDSYGGSKIFRFHVQSTKWSNEQREWSGFRH